MVLAVGVLGGDIVFVKDYPVSVNVGREGLDRRNALRNGQFPGGGIEGLIEIYAVDVGGAGEGA